MTPVLLSPKAAGARVGKSRKWVIDLIQRGELRGYNTGGQGHGTRYGIDPKDLDRWRESRQI